MKDHNRPSYGQQPVNMASTSRERSRVNRSALAHRIVELMRPATKPDVPIAVIQGRFGTYA